MVTRFEDKVQKIVDFVGNLKAFDSSLKNIDAWMKEADANLNEIKNASGSMTPEDRVSLTMELEEDVAAKVQVIQENIKTEEELLPQGENVSGTDFCNVQSDPFASVVFEILLSYYLVDYYYTLFKNKSVMLDEMT